MLTEDLSAFSIFKQVVDLGSFNKAAEAEGLNKNSVSLRVQSLERRLGVKLLGRTTKKVWLTEAGKRYYQAYARVAEELLLARDKVSGKVESSATPGGTLRIVAPSLLGSRCLAPLLAEFLAKNPGLEATLSTEGEPCGEVDLVLRFVAAEGGEVIIPRRRVLVASAAYLYKAGTPQTLAQLSTHACLRLSHEARWDLAGPKGEDSFTPKAKLSVSSEEALLSAMLSGAGVALLPLFAIQREAALGVVGRVLPEHFSEREGLTAHYPRGEFSSPWARFFVDFLRANLR